MHTVFRGSLLIVLYLNSEYRYCSQGLDRNSECKSQNPRLHLLMQNMIGGQALCYLYSPKRETYKVVQKEIPNKP